MSNLSPSTESLPVEVLIRPKRRWLRRWWVRICLVLLLILLISFTLWFVPRRTMVWLWWNRGFVLCDADRERAGDWIEWAEPRLRRPLWSHFFTVYRALSWVRSDDEITLANLRQSSLTTDGLFGLKRLARLEIVVLHDRQMGQGLDVFRDLPRFHYVWIAEVSAGKLAELKRLPQIDSLSLSNPQGHDIGLQHLTALPKLKDFLVADCRDPASLLKTLPELPQVEQFVLQDSGPLNSDDLSFLKQLPNLAGIDIVCRNQTLDDSALEHLSQLKHLKLLALRTPWSDVTDEALSKLNTMPALKEVIILGFQCTPSQIQRIKAAAPNCKITVN